MINCQTQLTTTQYNNIHVADKNIETWSPLTGNFPSDISCAMACAKLNKEPTQECKFVSYDKTTKECKTGTFGQNDHEIIPSEKLINIWSETKFCTGEPSPVANGRWVCHRKSSDSRCYLLCNVGYYADWNVIQCQPDQNGNPIWHVDLKIGENKIGENGYEWYKCRETVTVMVGGEGTYAKVQMVANNKAIQLPDFFNESNGNMGHGTIQHVFGQVLYYCSLMTVPQCYRYSGYQTQSEKFGLTDLAKSKYGHTSVRMDLVYILTGQTAGIVVQQLTDGQACVDQIVTDITTIKLEDGLSSEFGCTARFTDYSFIYIGGKKAVEINLISKDYRMLPGELNFERKKAGCDVIMIDGVETVLIAGGSHDDAQGTSEYFDKAKQMWKPTGNLEVPR